MKRTRTKYTQEYMDLVSTCPCYFHMYYRLHLCMCTGAAASKVWSTVSIVRHASLLCMHEYPHKGDICADMSQNADAPVRLTLRAIRVATLQSVSN